MRRPHPVNVHEAWVQSAPDLYRVAAFRGRGEWARGECQTFERAVEIARGFHTNRPVGVYAVRGTHQSLVLNVDGRTELKMVYLLTWTGAHNDPKVHVYVDADAANTALQTAEGGAVVAAEADICRPAFSGPALVKLFNGLGGPESEPVARFATYADGARRVFARIEAAGKGQPTLSAPALPPEADAPAVVSQPQEGTADMATKTATKAKKEKAPKAEGDPKRMGLARPVGKVGDLKPVRDGTGRALVLKAMNGKQTGEQIAKDLKMSESEVVGYARFFGKIGIGVDVDEKGKVTAVFPGSKTIDDVIVTPKKGE
jgi:hypothetical protein